MAYRIGRGLIGWSLALLTVAGSITTRAFAEPYGLIGYPLGMTFGEFIAKPIPESEGRKGRRILCLDGPEMRDHMIGVISVDRDIETRVGAKICVFAEPDLIGGPRWWEPATVTFAGKPMIWLFRFLDDRAASPQWRLFSISAFYRPDWEHRNDPVDMIEPKLIDLFGDGESYESDRISGRVWHLDGQTAEFGSEHLLGTVKQANYCIGVVDEATLAELNRRLQPFSRREWTVCIPGLARAQPNPG